MNVLHAERERVFRQGVHVGLLKERPKVPEAVALDGLHLLLKVQQLLFSGDEGVQLGIEYFLRGLDREAKIPQLLRFEVVEVGAEHHLAKALVIVAKQDGFLFGRVDIDPAVLDIDFLLQLLADVVAGHLHIGLRELLFMVGAVHSIINLIP